MWRAFQPLIHSEAKCLQLLITKNFTHQQIRTTFILKRRFPPKLHRKGEPEKNLKRKNYIYDLVKNTNNEKLPHIDVILRSYVEGLGNVGDKVTVPQNYAYNKLLLPGLAVYASKENIEKFWDKNAGTEKQYSSAYALYTVKSLQRVLLSVVMNMEQPWTLKTWHIKASFRKCGYIVPEYAISIPETPISGPDMNIEDKQFFVTVTINNKEQVKVKCRIHHWSTNPSDRIPYIPKFWEIDSPAILAEQVSILETLPKKTCLIRKPILNK